MKLIRLKIGRKTVFVNADKVLYFIECDHGGCEFAMEDGSFIKVDDSYHEIIKSISKS